MVLRTCKLTGVTAAMDDGAPGHKVQAQAGHVRFETTALRQAG